MSFFLFSPLINLSLMMITYNLPLTTKTERIELRATGKELRFEMKMRIFQ